MATVLRGENEIELTSRPWWLSHAIETPRGTVVARADGVSTTLKFVGGGGPDRYATSPEGQGSPVTYMVDLTEQDLVDHNLSPGVLKYPDVIGGARPRTNILSNPVTQQKAQALMDWLQNDCIGEPHDSM